MFKRMAALLLALCLLPLTAYGAIPYYEVYPVRCGNMWVEVPNGWDAVDSTWNAAFPALTLLTQAGEALMLTQIGGDRLDQLAQGDEMDELLANFAGEGFRLFNGSPAEASRLEEAYTQNGLKACRAEMVDQGYHMIWFKDEEDLYFIMYPDGEADYEAQVAELAESFCLLERKTPPAAVAADYDYEINAQGVTLTGYRGEDAYIRLPDTLGGQPVTVIGPQAFYETHVRSVEMPDTIERIETNAFSGCMELLQINLSRRLTFLGKGAFESCFRLQQVNLPEGLKVIDEGAFWGCLCLEKVSLPVSLEEIAPFNFAMCPCLENLEMAPGGVGFKVVDNVLFSQEGERLICYPAWREGASYSVPEGTVVIDPMAFDDATGLTTLNLPDSLEEIGQGAFFRAINLQTLYIPPQVKRLGTMPGVADEFGAIASQLTILGEAGSQAESYAAAQGYPFEALEAAGEPPAGETSRKKP